MQRAAAEDAGGVQSESSLSVWLREREHAMAGRATANMALLGPLIGPLPAALAKAPFCTLPVVLAFGILQALYLSGHQFSSTALVSLCLSCPAISSAARYNHVTAIHGHWGAPIAQLALHAMAQNHPHVSIIIDGAGGTRGAD